MKLIKGIFLFFLSLAMITSCSEETTEQDALSNTAVTFSAGITATRTTTGGDFWTTTDKVGIFMLTTGGSLTTTSNVLADNAQYTVANVTTGALTGNPIYYPQLGNVDFIAYYPHGMVTTNYKYNISVAEQTTESAQNALDVLYAKEDNKVKSQTAVDLSFDHVLSKITLNITLGSGLTLTGNDITEVSLTGMPLTATLSLQDGTIEAGAVGGFAALKATTSPASALATFTAIIVPQTGGTNRTAVFTVGGAEYFWTIPDTETFAAGNHYTYPVTVKKTGVTVDAPTIAGWGRNDHGTEVLKSEVVRIPAGTFLMGSSDGSNIGDVNGSGLNTTLAELNRGNTVETQHRVTLTKDFYMSKYQITNAQYAAFLNAKGIGNPATATVGNYGSQTLVSASSGIYDWGLHWNTDRWEPASGYENHPVIFVSWYGAKAYADWVGGALPTEAQWEYACRGGKENLPFGIGEGTKLTYGMANFNTDYPYDVAQSGQYDASGSGWIYKTTAVGTYPYANGYGLYDMHGNVWEWCGDWYNDNNGSTATDPLGPSTGDYRVCRGGNWSTNAQHCRSARRLPEYPGLGKNGIGFRVVFVP